MFLIESKKKMKQRTMEMDKCKEIKEEKRRESARSNLLVSIVSIGLTIIIFSSFINAQNQETVEEELARLSQEITDAGYGWLVNYTGDVFPKIEVYEKDGEEKIADFGEISSDNKYRILLTNLGNRTQDVFDLKVKGNPIEFDYIVDPDISACDTLNTANTVYTLTANVTSVGTCFNITANYITIEGAGFSILYGTGTIANTYGVHIRGANGTIIRNVYPIKQMNSGGTAKAGISYDNAENGTVFNNTILTNGSDAHGIMISATS